MKLIDDWKRAHKFLSVQVGAAGAILLVGWGSISVEQQHTVLAFFHLDSPTVFAFIGIFVAIGSRLVSQRKHDDDDDEHDEH